MKDERYRLFLAYRDAKHRVEKTLRYDDAQRAADAWVEFVNFSLPDGRKIAASVPLDILYRGETIQ